MYSTVLPCQLVFSLAAYVVFSCGFLFAVVCSLLAYDDEPLYDVRDTSNDDAEDIYGEMIYGTLGPPKTPSTPVI